MEKTCQRCGNSFECRNDDILNCECATVPLSAQARRYMDERYTDCLCTSCLHEISEAFPAPDEAWIRIDNR